MLTEKDYCNYEIRNELIKLGYPAYMYDNTEVDKILGAILLYEAQKWLREEKGIAIFAIYDKNTSKWFATVINMDSLETINLYKCDLYEEALSEGIKESVKILKGK